jgi:hypothetical protein
MFEEMSHRTQCLICRKYFDADIYVDIYSHVLDQIDAKMREGRVPEPRTTHEDGLVAPRNAPYAEENKHHPVRKEYPCVE